ncbi:MAG: hypothetical protein ACXWQO_19430 [Bdellovibrionota bacterium]
MKIFLFAAVCLFSFSALAAKHKGCDFAAAGFKNKKEFVKFFGKLQAAAEAGDQAAISKMANYPFRVGESRIKDETELKRRFSSVFTPKILAKISAQKFDTLFCDYEGAKIGKDKPQIWIQEIEGVIVITNISQ